MTKLPKPLLSIIFFIGLATFLTNCSESVTNTGLDTNPNTNSTDTAPIDTAPTLPTNIAPTPKDDATVVVRIETEQKDDYKWSTLKHNFYTFPANISKWTPKDHEFWKKDLERNRITLAYRTNGGISPDTRSKFTKPDSEIGVEPQSQTNVKTLWMVSRYIIHTTEFMEIMERFYKTIVFVNDRIIRKGRHPDPNHKYVDLDGKMTTSLKMKNSDGDFEAIGDPRISLFEFMTRIRSGFRAIKFTKTRPNAGAWFAAGSRYRTKFDLEKAIATGKPEDQNWVADHGWAKDDNEMGAIIPEEFYLRKVVYPDDDPKTRQDTLLSANNIGIFLHEIYGHSLFHQGHGQDDFDNNGPEELAFWRGLSQVNNKVYTEMAYVIDDLSKIFLPQYFIDQKLGAYKPGAPWWVKQAANERVMPNQDPFLNPTNSYFYQLHAMWKDPSDGFFDGLPGVTWTGQGGYYNELVVGKKYDEQLNGKIGGFTTDKYTPIPNYYDSVVIEPR